MAEKKKEFKAGTYAVTVGIVLAVVLTLLTVFAFKTRYTAFSPDKVAQAFTDTIVQTGDGYNAYKNTLISKNQKYGDFIRNAYMRPYVNDGEDVKQADFVGTGSEEEQTAIDAVYNKMFTYYCELVATVGYDNYDMIFDSYFAKLVEVRKEIYGDEYMDMDYMFGAFEANVAAYADAVTGTERVIASDNKTILKEETEGAYQQMFGEETEVEVDDIVDGRKIKVPETRKVYHLTTTVTDCTELGEAEVAEYVAAYKERIAPIAASGEAKADRFNLQDEEKNKPRQAMIDAFAKLDCSEDIDSVASVDLEVTTQDGTVVATQNVYVVKIGSSWYVDNTYTFTDGLYLAK